MTSSQLQILNDYGLKTKGFELPCIHPGCKETFRFTATLYGHIRRHSDNNRCPYCGSVWEGLGALVFHVRSHTQNKPYTCPFPDCNYAGTQKGNLKTHLESETHEHEMSPQILQVVMSLDRLNCWSANGNKRRFSEAHSDIDFNVLEERSMSAITSTPLQFTEPARKRRRLPQLEPDKSTSSTQPSPFAVNAVGLQMKNRVSRPGYVVPRFELQSGHQAPKEVNDRNKKLEEENRMLRTRVTAAQVRISALEKMCYQESIQRATLAETVNTMNKEKDAADAQIHILVQRLKSEMAMRLQAQQETVTLRERCNSKEPATWKSMECIKNEEN